MKLVIDIPEDYYKAIKEIPVEQSTADMLIIRNGTPLPKGHGRLIDADELIKDRVENDNTVILVNTAPTIIEADGGDTETWNGYHGRVTAPKGTFKRIYEEADGGDAE